MKYLKTYLHKNIQIILDDLHDICLELTDKGYIVTIDTDFNMTKIPNIHVHITHETHRLFLLDDVSEILDRMRDYMEERKYQVTGGPCSWISRRYQKYTNHPKLREMRLSFHCDYRKYNSTSKDFPLM